MTNPASQSVTSSAPADHDIVIHVGLPKTGSTTLQRGYFPNLSGLAYLGKTAIPKYSELRTPGDFDAATARREAEDALASLDRNKVLLSCESFSEHVFLPGMRIEGFAERLAAVYPQARIIVILRRQDDFVESLYKMWVSAGYPFDIRTFLCLRPGDTERNKRLAIPLFCDLTSLNWLNLIETYRRIFGQDRVSCLPYELFVESPDAFTKALCNELGVDHRVFQSNGRRYNLGLSVISYRIARLASAIFYTRFTPHDDPRNRLWRTLTTFIERQDKKTGATSNLLRLAAKGLRRAFSFYKIQGTPIDRLFYRPAVAVPLEIRNEIMNACRDSNESLQSHVPFDLSRYGYY